MFSAWCFPQPRFFLLVFYAEILSDISTLSVLSCMQGKKWSDLIGLSFSLWYNWLFITIYWPNTHSCSLFLPTSAAWQKDGKLFRFHQPGSQTRCRTQRPPITLTPTTWAFKPHAYREASKDIQLCASGLLGCLLWHFVCVFIPLLLTHLQYIHTPQWRHCDSAHHLFHVCYKPRHVCIQRGRCEATHTHVHQVLTPSHFGFLFIWIHTVSLSLAFPINTNLYSITDVGSVFSCPQATVCTCGRSHYCVIRCVY